MPKEIVVTPVSNTISLATTNGKGLITGQRKDVTIPCIGAVMQYLRNQRENDNDGCPWAGVNLSDSSDHLCLLTDEQLKRCRPILDKKADDKK